MPGPQMQLEGTCSPSGGRAWPSGQPSWGCLFRSCASSRLEVDWKTPPSVWDRSDIHPRLGAGTPRVATLSPAGSWSKLGRPGDRYSHTGGLIGSVFFLSCFPLVAQRALASVPGPEVGAAAGGGWVRIPHSILSLSLSRADAVLLPIGQAGLCRLPCK